VSRTRSSPTPAEALAPPSRRAAAVFALKASLLRARRAARDLSSGPSRHPRTSPDGFPVLLAESVTALWTSDDPAERRLQCGKAQNLRVAAKRFDGVTVPAGEVIGFWRQLGRATPARGFVVGRELREGCLIPAIGGGLCQLSNALYDLALKTGAQIVERHAHSRAIPGSAAAVGRDATVFYNYVDLRFCPAQNLRIEARLTAESLVVRFWSDRAQTGSAAKPARARVVLLDPTAHGCDTCGQHTCFRHIPEPTSVGGQRPVVLTDGPLSHEHAAYLAAQAPGARLAPLPRPASVLRRVATRLARRHGPAAVRRAQLERTVGIARAYARSLTPEDTELIVAQSLLPFLEEDGVLGGRRVTVLLDRLPLAVLHARLDAALVRFPERRLLGDFRAPDARVRAEARALSDATCLVTAHAELAQLFAGRASQVAWRRPDALVRQPAQIRTILFPGPGAARKGAYEVREAARALGLEVVSLGRTLEGAGFWDGVAVRSGTPADLSTVHAVVQPSLFETDPSVLLTARASGIPIVATAGCGLLADEGVALVAFGDSDAVIAALTDILARTDIEVSDRPGQ
jgi:hypothetical protein